MIWNAAHHEEWEMRQLDEYLEGPDDEDEELLAPVYIIGTQAKETATGRDLTDDECEEMSQSFCDQHPLEVWMRAEKRVDFLVKTGVLK